MEIAHWLDWEDIAEDTVSSDRIYIGCECCEAQLPDSDKMFTCLNHLQDRGRKFTLVTPLVTDAGLVKLSSLFDMLARHGKSIEVVCNDWGVFETVLAHKFITPVIGRLLSRQCTDPRFGAITEIPNQQRYEKDVTHIDGTVARLTYAPPTDAMLRHLKRPAVMNSEVLKYLNDLGVNRFEISNVLQGVEIMVPDGWQVTLHLPTVIIAVRRCLAANANCFGTKCSRQVQMLVDSGFPSPIYMSPAEIYYQNEDISRIVDKTNIDRFVYSKNV